MKHFLAAFLCCTVLSTTIRAQVPPDKAEATFTVHDPQLEWKLWASEPLFCNPTSMDIDHLGRVWVCEAVNYRQILRGKPVLRPEGDRILILEDSKGTGRADKVTVFAQAPYIQAPLGIAVAKEPTGPGWKVYVCQSPDILVYEDKDGDGHADGPPKKLLTGFRGIDHDHGVHGISIGPDGKLYFSVGDQGVQDLQSSDGKGRKWTTNHTDCQAGTIWRCDLDGTNLELIAHNFRNEYEPCVDSFGNIWTSDNDDDGNEQTRICYVMPGGNYGYWPRGKGESHWHEEQPGVVPKVLRTYFGSPTGMCIYEGTLLPKKYWGQPLHTDAGPRHVRCYHTKPKGAGYDIEREDIVTSTDNWFRPSDVCVAPDGSVFVADWYDPGVGGHGMGDTTRGRIYRLAPKGQKYQVPKVDLASNDGRLAALASPNLAVRHLAMATIMQLRPDLARELLEPAVFQTENPTLQARAFIQWMRWSRLSSHFNRLFDRNSGLRAFSPQLRMLWTRMLYLTSDIKFLEDASYRLRLVLLFGLGQREGRPIDRELLLSLPHVDPALAKDLFLELAGCYDGHDRFYLAAIGIAVGTDPKRREVILADFDKHLPEWNDKVADLVWELRPPSVMPTLGKRLTDAAIPAAQRARIVDILATSDDKGAGESLLKVLRADVPTEVKDRVIENLRLFLPGKWAGLAKTDEFKATVDHLLAGRDTTASGLRLVAAAHYTPAIERVAKLAAARDPVAIRTLGQLPDRDAAVQLEIVLHTTIGQMRSDKPSLTAATEAVAALGAQAAARADSPAGRHARTVLERIVTAHDRPTELKSAALAALAGSRAGTQWLLDKHAKRELSADLVADAGRLLRNTPYQDLRNKALIAFPAVQRLDPKKLPPPSVLAARRGDAERGKQLLAASLTGDAQCLKCHAVRGVGGHIGPDLSMIGKKASRENLYESILLPSKAIADQFVQWQVTTARGVTISGLLIEETADHLIVRDANGKDARIDRADVTAKDKSPVSLMPEDIAKTLTEEELVNLVEHLTTLQTPALSPPRWHILGPFANDGNDVGLDRDFGPEKTIDMRASYAGKSGPVRWRAVTPDAQGYVDLQAFHGPDSPQSVSYMTGVVESPADQDAKVLLGTDDGGKLWVNRELAYTSRTHRPAVPGQDTVAVNFRKGPNRLLLKVANGDGAHGFYLTILSEQELRPAEDAVK
jgi:putative membrane-bound dehydrogenase-like protein